jgi:hypothetical protein
VLAAAAVGACRRTGPDWRILQLYAGETSVDLLAHPSKVQMFRVGPASAAKADVRAGPYAATGPVVDLAPALAEEASALLADPASYDWQRMKKDAFQPQAALWFVRGANVLEVAVDLRSAKVEVFAGGQRLGWQQIDPSRERMLALVKTALAGDAVIGALK